MCVLVTLVFGGIIGCNVGMVMRDRIAVTWNILAGCAGAGFGGILSGSLRAGAHLTAISAALAAAAVGALVLLAIANLIHWMTVR